MLLRQRMYQGVFETSDLVDQESAVAEPRSNIEFGTVYVELLNNIQQHSTTIISRQYSAHTGIHLQYGVTI